jgi:hypothetical protein
MYIANRAFGSLRKLVLFTNTAKSLIWLLRMNKLKTKYKALVQSKLESLSLSTALLAIYRRWQQYKNEINMKKTILLYTVLALLISCGKQNKKNNVEKNEIKETIIKKKDFIKTFEGTINNKYGILMKITCDEGKIVGNYFYKSQKIKIEVKGNLNEKEEISIQEFDKKGNQTGVFNGIMPNENKITGTWSKPNGNSEMPFSLIESNTNFETSVQKEKIRRINLAGNYQNISKNGNVKITSINSSKFKFEISVVSNSGNIGEIKGTGNIVNGIGKYYRKGCLIKFKLNQNELSISEKNCENEKGYGVYFSGKYMK